MNALGFLGRNFASNFARQRVDEESTTHANLTMNSPDGEMNSAGLERLAPGEHVLVNAVDECAVEIEKKSRSVGAVTAHDLPQKGTRKNKSGETRRSFT